MSRTWVRARREGALRLARVVCDLKGACRVLRRVGSEPVQRVRWRGEAHMVPRRIDGKYELWQG